MYSSFVRVRFTCLATIVLAVLSATSALAAPPSVWETASSGNWNNAAAWDPDGVPDGPAESATIDATGAGYTVTLNISPTLDDFTLNSSDALLSSSSKVLTIGGSALLQSGSVLWSNSTWSGTGSLTNDATMTARQVSAINISFAQGATGQLVIEALGSTSSFTVANGFNNSGTISLTSPTGHAAFLNVTSGTLVNAGTLNVQPGSGGARTLKADLTNNDEVNINTDATFSKTTGLYTNNADFNIAAGAMLSISSSGQRFVQAGGTLDIDGAFKMTSAKFDFNGGSLTGNVPSLNSCTLTIGPGSIGAGEFNLHGIGSLVGDIAAAQTINIRANSSTASTTAATGFTNNGTINMTSPTGHAASLTVTAGTLVNEGTFNVQPGSGGSRTLKADLTNNDEVNINTNATFSKTSGLYTNNADFNIAAGKTLSISSANQRFVQAGGILDIDGAFNMTSAKFDFNGGSLTGNIPSLNNCTLTIGPGSIGAGQFNLHGTSFLVGNIAAAQTVNIRANTTTASTTAATGFTNNGTINMTSPTGHTASLTVTTGILVNDGMFNVQPGAGGTRTLKANLTNNDEVNINTNATFSKTSGLYTNNADFNIAAGKTLSISSANQRFVQAGGTLDIDGAFNMSSAKFDFNGGSLTGNIPSLNNCTLTIGPGSIGAGQFNLHGTSFLVGDIAAAQTVNIRANTTTASTTAATGFTNNGTINMTSPTGHAAFLNVTAGTLVNEGTFNVQPGSGGSRTLKSDLANNDEVNINTDATFSRTSGLYTNNADFNIAAGATLSISSANQRFVQAGGTLDIDGAFTMTSAKFDFNGGALTGNVPSLNSCTLTIGPGSIGAGEFNLHGTGGLVGDIAAAQTVNIRANGTTASTTAATGFTNNGTINMTSPTGHAAYLYVTTGSLVNDGMFNVQPGSGGARTLAAQLDNRDSFTVNTSMTLGKTGADHVNSGHFAIPIATATVNILGQGFTNAPGGLVSGIGTLKVPGSGSLLNQGTVQPGNSAGILRVDGDFDQDAAGTFAIEIGGEIAGDDYDRLVVTDTADLDGLLEISLLGSYLPDSGDSFVILTADQVNGFFSNAQSTVFFQGGMFDVSYTGTTVVLTNYQVPEPGSFILLVSALAAFPLLRRRVRA